MTKKSWCYIPVRPDLQAKVDIEDFERVSAHKWRATRGTTGRVRVVTSFRTPKGVRQMTLGAFLMRPKAGLQVYPRRFNEGLDYRKENLIVCTVQERQRLLPKNRKKQSSQFRGVSYSKSDDKWRAGIEVEGKAINLGLFSYEEDAALAYNQAARKYFGELAYQNPLGRRKSLREG